MALKIVISIPINFNLELNESELDAVRDYYGLTEDAPEEMYSPEKLSDAIENEIIRHKIIEKIKKEGKSVPDIAKEIEVEPHKVLHHIVTLRARGLVDVDQINEEIPTFKSIKEV